MKYIDYTKYCAFNPLLTVEQFDSVIEKACSYLDLITMGRIASVFGTETYKEERACKAIAHVCNVMYELDHTSQLQSVSNDGYSESYKTLTFDESEKKLAREARMWLSGTGLTSL